MTTTFQIGQTYQTSSPCDHECTIRVTITRRTAKTVTVTSEDIPNQKIHIFRVYVWHDVESFRPWGTHSMCPIMTADKVVPA
jgi:hypothetical protein